MPDSRKPKPARSRNLHTQTTLRAHIGDTESRELEDAHDSRASGKSGQRRRRVKDDAETAAEVPSAGTLIDGKYRVTSIIGRGGMGSVLRAKDESLDRDVAIKLIRGSRFRTASARRQFVTEARALAKIRHANVVEVYALGEHDGAPYFAMEYVSGESLETWIRRGPTPFALDMGLGLLEQICRGLSAIHAAGVVHGDIKPANILIGPAFRVAVADFGLARVHADAARGSKTIRGTPHYLAPETILTKPVDAELVNRADIYSLGVLAYQLLSGELPFDHHSVNVLLGLHLEAAPPEATKLRPELPPAFELTLQRALAKNPELRFATADEFRRELFKARSTIAAQPQKLRFVVADDDAAFRRWLESVLQKEFPGCDVVLAQDGNAAYAAALEKKPHLVFTDLQMPDANGLELTASLKENASTRNTPIIVLTAVGGAPDWKVLQGIGADGFLVKPTDGPALAALAKRMLTPSPSA